MLVPFSGLQKREPHKRTYNFYLSQLRIRVEMSFSLLSTKWRIYRRNLEYSLEKNIRIINAASRLHNFVIDSDKLDYSSVSSGDRDAINVLEHPDGNTGHWGYLTNLPPRSREIDSGVCQANILSAIQVQDLQRPSHNHLYSPVSPLLLPAQPAAACETVETL
jgi:hypothetical protein